jgi:PAS domain S-box-containing protein
MTEGDSNEFGSNLVQRMAIPAAVFDLDGQRVAANTRWETLYAAASPAGPLSRCLEVGRLGASTSVIDEDADGEDEIRWTSAPLLDGDTPTAVLILADALAAPSESTVWPREEKARSLFEASQVGLNLCRMDDGLWLESNPAFLDIIGYSAAEADGGLTYWELTPDEYEEEEQKQLRSLTETGRYGPYEKEFIRKDGTRVPVRLNGFTITRNGEEYIWSMIEDITKERDLEKQVEAERLKTIQASRLATLGEMAAGFAHEINNPLTVISGYGSALRSILESGDPALVDETVEAIDDSVRRIEYIVKGLRKFAREDAGEYLDDVAISAVIEDAVRLTNKRLEHHGVDLSVESIDEVITCRPIELTQVLVNLINNAFDAVKSEGGAWVRVEASLDDAEVHIVVEDSGERPPAEVVDKMFEPFFTTKRVGEGTGLGLSISRGIIGDMGGELYLDAASANTRFVVRFPVEVTS